MRSREPFASTDVGDLPYEFEKVRDRILDICRRHGGRISDRNPAASTRAKHGALYLRVVRSAAEVPEELSIWEAVSGGPYKLRVLDKPEFDQFCSLMIKAVETANAHYGCLVRLWLSPQD